MLGGTGAGTLAPGGLAPVDAPPSPFWRINRGNTPSLDNGGTAPSLDRQQSGSSLESEAPAERSPAGQSAPQARNGNGYNSSGLARGGRLGLSTVAKAAEAVLGYAWLTSTDEAARPSDSPVITTFHALLPASLPPTTVEKAGSACGSGRPGLRATGARGLWNSAGLSARASAETNLDQPPKLVRKSSVKFVELSDILSLDEIRSSPKPPSLSRGSSRSDSHLAAAELSGRSALAQLVRTSGSATKTTAVEIEEATSDNEYGGYSSGNGSGLASRHSGSHSLRGSNLSAQSYSPRGSPRRNRLAYSPRSASSRTSCHGRSGAPRLSSSPRLSHPERLPSSRDSSPGSLGSPLPSSGASPLDSGEFARIARLISLGVGALSQV